jgi:diguanylate cyclase
MSSKPTTPEQNPAEIAREAFRRLATRRIAPTPEAYRDIYNEIAGIAAAPASPVGSIDPGPESVLSQFATRLTENTGDLADFGRRFNRAVKSRDWDGYAKTLSQLVEKHFVSRKGGIEVAGLPADDEQTRTLRDLLSRTLTFAVASLLSGAPVLVAEAESLGAATKLAHSEEALAEIALRLKQLCFQIELRGGDSGEQQELLLRLFKLLLENVSELLDDDSWLRGQIEAVQNLIAGPLDVRALEEATRSLKEVIYKQGQLKHSLSDVKLTVKNMMMTFIDRLGQVAASTGDFHEKIGGYSEKISKADNIAELNNILDEVLKETRIVQSEALKARDKMVLARQEVQDAENRIHTLEAKLQHLSELVREDQLTGTPLCIAILDLDDFKKLNDTYGHIAGDAALKHLVKIVKDTLRSMDVIARFGGEEFLILMPETSVEAAASTMTRLQRELTKHFFLHDNEKVLITFSAGVALRRPNEEQTELVKRADKAMYTAKQTGKNRVVVAE